MEEVIMVGNSTFDSISLAIKWLIENQGALLAAIGVIATLGVALLKALASLKSNVEALRIVGQAVEDVNARAVKTIVNSESKVATVGVQNAIGAMVKEVSSGGGANEGR